MIDTREFELLARLHDALILSSDYQQETVAEFVRRSQHMAEASSFLRASANNIFEQEPAQ